MKTTKEFLEDMPLLLCCQDHGRDYSETRGGKYPPSDHSPGCKNYKTIPFVRIKLTDGTIMVVSRKEVGPITKEYNRDCQGGEEVATVLGEIMLTRDQLEKMPEYDP